jgi:hypothetical protein
MGGFLLHVGFTGSCPHGGQIQVTPGNAKVTVGGQAVATMSDQFLITGCAFTVGTKPQPCVKVQWTVPAARVTLGGQAAITQSSVGLCMSADQIPAGPPMISVTQTRVQGT